MSSVWTQTPPIPPHKLVAMCRLFHFPKPISPSANKMESILVAHRASMRSPYHSPCEVLIE